MAMNPRLLRPTASGFDPRRIAGLGLWLDASVDSSLTFNATTVSEWRDLSGNGRHYAQSTGASQPGTSTLNNRRVLSTTGSQFMTGNAATLTLTQNLPGLTLFAAGSAGSDANRNLVFFSSSANVNAARVLLGTNNSFSGSGFGVGGRRLDADSFAGISYSQGAAAQVFTGLFDYANSDLFLFESGTQKASSTSFQTTGNTSDTSSIGSGLFGNAIGNGLFTATLGEVLIYQRVLTTSERQRVERALGRKWGITVA